MADTEPGEVAEVDFKTGVLYDPVDQRRRFVYGLVVTFAPASTSMSMSPSPRTSLLLIAGIEDAWAFFGGITKKVVIDNLKAAVVKSDRYAPSSTGPFWNTRSSGASSSILPE